MTPQEAQMLDDLVRKVEGTQLTEKDPDADALLRDGLARDPDAIYKLAQTVLIQNLALEQARAQMQRMQQQLAPPQQQPPARATSFLGGLLHHNAPQVALPPSGQWQNVPSYPQGGPPNYAASPAYGGGYAPGGGGFLRSAATTAAGVAGGMLAFEGVESLLHGGFGGGYGGFGGGMPGQETIVNNYYGDPSQQGRDPNTIPGPDEQPQGPYDTSGQGQGDQGDAQGYLDDSGASDMSGQDAGQDDSQDYADDSGGGDFGEGGGDGGDLV